MIKVIIVDDHPIVRKGLKEILSETPDLVVAGEADNGCELLEKVRSDRWDVVVLDLSMPGQEGLETLRQLKSERPKLPVLVLTIHPEDQYAVRALQAGASGYLTKECAPDRLVEAIRKLAGGGRYINPNFAERLAFRLGTSTEDLPHASLSNREFQVLRLIASGKTVKEVGEELSLSIKTISTYRSRILEKMKMRNNAELTHYAIRQKLVD